MPFLLVLLSVLHVSNKPIPFGSFYGALAESGAEFFLGQFGPFFQRNVYSSGLRSVSGLRRFRPELIPRTHLLAYIAPEDPIAVAFVNLCGHVVSTVLDRVIRYAQIGIHHVGLHNGVRWAGINTASTRPAVIQYGPIGC